MNKKHTLFITALPWPVAWLFPLLLFMCLHANAQAERSEVPEQSGIRDSTPAAAAALHIPEGGLKIGDYIPAIILQKVFNYPDSGNISQRVSLQEFSKDRLVILDFGGLYCKPCIESAEHLDSLTARFNGKFTVLPVVAGLEDQVKKLAQRRNWRMPYMSGDPELTAHFPHWYIPHLVWLYQGKVKAVTFAADATAANITAMLQGKETTLAEKRDVMATPETPLVQLARQQGVPLQFQSALTGYIAGLGGRDPYIDGSHIQLNYDNVSLLMLYMNALKMLPNHILMESADSLTLQNSRMDTSHLFCYQLRAPLSVGQEHIRDKIVSDLNAQFALHGRFEYRMLPCYAISGDATKGIDSHPDGLDIGALVYSLNRPFDQDPDAARFVDESKSAVYVQRLNTDSLSRDIPALQRALQPYGLRVSAVQRRIRVFVIGDRPVTNSDLSTHLIKP